MKLKQPTLDVVLYLQANEGEGSLQEIGEALGRKPQSINGSGVTLTKNGIARREKRIVDFGEDKPSKEVSFLILTEEGMNFVQAEDEDEE